MSRGRQMTPRGQMSGRDNMPAIATLPPELKALFDPRPALDFRRPIPKKKSVTMTGVTALPLSELFEKETPPLPPPYETPLERRARVKKERMAANDAALEEKIKAWNPDGGDRGDAFNTLFVARLSHDTTDKKLRREFETYGPVKSLRVVEDEEGNPRGYAFIEFENESDMRTAYKSADGRKIDGKRVMVDVERGRTVKSWRPRRLGGGLGNTRKDKPKKADLPPPDFYGGGDRGTTDGHYGSSRRDDGGDRGGGGGGRDRDDRVYGGGGRGSDDRGRRGDSRERTRDRKRDRSSSRDRDRGRDSYRDSKYSRR